MASLECNIAKGRIAELVNRVNTNDPTNAAFVIVPIDKGAATDDSLRDADTLSALLAIAGVTERTTGGWNRKTLSDAGGLTATVDDTGNVVNVDAPNQIWTGVSGPTLTVTHLVIGYDSDTTAGTDANIVPLGFWDFAITPDGSDVQATIADFFQSA